MQLATPHARRDARPRSPTASWPPRRCSPRSSSDLFTHVADGPRTLRRAGGRDRGRRRTGCRRCCTRWPGLACSSPTTRGTATRRPPALPGPRRRAGRLRRLLPPAGRPPDLPGAGAPGRRARRHRRRLRHARRAAGRARAGADVHRRPARRLAGWPRRCSPAGCDLAEAAHAARRRRRQRGVLDRAVRAQPAAAGHRPGLPGGHRRRPRVPATPRRLTDRIDAARRRRRARPTGRRSRTWSCCPTCSARSARTRSTPCWPRPATACARAGCWSCTTSCSTTTGPGRPLAALWFLQYVAYRGRRGVVLRRRAGRPAARTRLRRRPTGRSLIPDITKVVLRPEEDRHDRTTRPLAVGADPDGDPPRGRAAARPARRAARLPRVLPGRGLGPRRGACC